MALPMYYPCVYSLGVSSSPSLVTWQKQGPRPAGNGKREGMEQAARADVIRLDALADLTGPNVGVYVRVPGVALPVDEQVNESGRLVTGRWLAARSRPSPAPLQVDSVHPRRRLPDRRPRLSSCWRGLHAGR